MTYLLGLTPLPPRKQLFTAKKKSPLKVKKGIGCKWNIRANSGTFSFMLGREEMKNGDGWIFYYPIAFQMEW